MTNSNGEEKHDLSDVSLLEDQENISEKKSVRTCNTGCFKSVWQRIKKTFSKRSFLPLQQEEEQENLLSSKIWPEYSAPLLSFLTFQWCMEILNVGIKKTLKMEDFYQLDERDKTNPHVQRFDAIWKLEMKKNRPSFVRALHTMFKKPFWIFSFAGLIWFVCITLGPIILRQMLNFINDSSIPNWEGYIYGICFFVNASIGAISINWFYHSMVKIGAHMRSSVIMSIYSKILTMSTRSKQKTGVGMILNRMSNDVEKISEFIWIAHTGWQAILHILVSVIILYQLIGWASLGGLGMMGTLTPIGIFISRKVTSLKSQLLKITDTRLKLTNEILKGMKIIKVRK